MRLRKKVRNDKYCHAKLDSTSHYLVLSMGLNYKKIRSLEAEADFTFELF